LHQEAGRDFQWEAGRDFPSATAEPERPVLPEHRDAPESRQAQWLPDERLKAVYRLALLAVQAQQVGPQRARAQAPPLARADESELLQAQPLQVRQAS
jgi:hypothetical protein